MPPPSAGLPPQLSLPASRWSVTLKKRSEALRPEEQRSFAAGLDNIEPRRSHGAQ